MKILRQDFVPTISKYPQSSQCQRGDSGRMGTLALQPRDRSLFHCSSWKPWEFAVAMSRVPGIRQGRLPGAVCVSRQETRRVWRPTWQVGAALATCLLSVRALSKSSHSQCFLCVRSAFSGKKKERKNKKLFWKVCSQHSA